MSIGISPLCLAKDQVFYESKIRELERAFALFIHFHAEKINGTTSEVRDKLLNGYLLSVVVFCGTRMYIGTEGIRKMLFEKGVQNSLVLCTRAILFLHDVSELERSLG